MKKIACLLRVKHYIKNLLVFAPIFFSMLMISKEYLLEGTFAFIQFCLLASSIYIINDIHDVDKDRLHPTKCKRPIASGEVSVLKAKVIVAILLISIIMLQIVMDVQNIQGWLVLIVYFIMNVLYSVYGFKNYPLIDVYILSLGFVLRIMYGATCTSIKISSWLYLVVFFGALFMGFGKRRNELKRCGNDTREVLSKYSTNYLAKGISISMTLSIVFYSFWCMEKDMMIGAQYFLFSIPIFAFVLLRYSLDIETDADGDPTSVILNDKLLIGLVIGLAVVLGILIYLG